MTDEEETARVSMVWPAELKEAVKEKGGPRNITEFTIEAVRIHLGQDASIGQLTEELNQAKYTVQLLADRLVMGGEHTDRMQALLEVELPDYLDTTGWPPAFAGRVRPAPQMTPVTVHESTEAMFKHLDKIVETEMTPDAVVGEDFDANLDGPTGLSVDDDDQAAEAEVAVTIPEQAAVMAEQSESPRSKELLDAVATGGEDDFFSKIMAKTGQDLSEVPGLKPASEIEKPEPKPLPTPVENLCPKCGEELIDGECWTCS